MGVAGNISDNSFSAQPLRSLRLCGDFFLNKFLNRGDAENAAVAQRKFTAMSFVPLCGKCYTST